MRGAVASPPPSPNAIVGGILQFFSLLPAPGPPDDGYLNSGQRLSELGVLPWQMVVDQSCDSTAVDREAEEEAYFNGMLGGLASGLAALL
jgi:hypothetical protein